MIYLIGGAPCSGKTTVANALAKKLNIPILSTDVIRGWMQKLLSQEDYPALFHAVNLTAEEYLTNNSSQQIIEKEKAQLKIVANGIIAFIKANYEWNSYIIEGTGITPDLVASVKKSNKDILAVELVEKDKRRIRETIFQRGLWGEPDSYGDNLKDLEVEWVMKFNNWIEEESKKFHIPYIAISNRENLISGIFELFSIK